MERNVKEDVPVARWLLKQNLRPINIHEEKPWNSTRWNHTKTDHSCPHSPNIPQALSHHFVTCSSLHGCLIFVFPCVEMSHRLAMSRRLICYNSTHSPLGMNLALTSLWRDRLVALWFQSMKYSFWTIGLLFGSPRTTKMELDVWALWTARVYPISVQMWWQHPLIEDRSKCVWSWFCRF